VVAALAAGLSPWLAGWFRWRMAAIWRVAAEPAEFLQCGGYSDFAWAGAGYSDEAGMVHALGFRPVARNVTDCAFFLSVLAGFDHHSPIFNRSIGEQFARPLERSFKGVRVAMFKDMGLPWDAEVKSAVKAQGKVFESLGCVVEEAEPDFTDANECFVAWRHWSTELALVICWRHMRSV